MWSRPPVLIAAILLLGAAAAGTWWWRAAASEAESVATDEALPVPPIPPRIAGGADYDRCLSMLNTDPGGARAFADAWFATGGDDGAEHCLALATIQLGEPDRGAELMDQLAGKSRASDTAKASIYGQAGQAWLMAGDADRALASLTLALTMTPDDPDLLLDRSIANATIEHYQEAADDLTRALDRDPRRADALVLRSAAWRHLEQFELAQDDVDRAFELDPEDADALLERGILRQRRGDREGARHDWEQAVQLAPDSATADLAQQNLALLDAGPERR